jgi:hypothetical protein
MAKQMPNERIVTLKLTRGDLCNLILAATSLKHSTQAERWEVLRVKLKKILADFDAKNAE